MKKISLIVMSCIIACGLLANHSIVKGGEMSPKVEDTVSIDKKITDSQWLSNNSDTLEVDTAVEDSGFLICERLVILVMRPHSSVSKLMVLPITLLAVRSVNMAITPTESAFTSRKV